AQAGRKGAITVSTNMAGRGTDIILGGTAEMMAKIEFTENNRIPDAEPEAFQKLVEQYEASCAAEREEVKKAGGLHILGTERHESRRIDNQLRGRAGRQGDPGSSRFYLSLEDDLMRIFAGDKVKNLMDRMGMPDDEPIEHPWVTKSVQNAQQKVEERNFDVRKNLLEYDDVMSAQRKTVYTMRQQMLEGRYQPEEVDDDGKSTGEFKTFAPRKEIVEEVVPRVTEVLGMFAETPIRAQTDGKSGSSTIPRESFEKAKMVELSHLQTEVYQWWGVKLVVEGRENDAAGLYDELVETVPLALTEQRERLLDLVDRIIGAMVEESCPGNKTPDDWDWGGIREGFTEHFGISPGDDIESFGDQELLARRLYDRAFEVVSSKEKELGIEMLCRVFRHLYLEEVDRAWVEHLTNMDHLRDGIGLRGYGQKDPKQEYKKEGYDLFVNMTASVCSLVITNLLKFKVRRQEDIAAIEAQDAQKHAAQLEAATARHGDEDEEGATLGPRGRQQVALPSSRPAAPKIGRNDLCPCGSGKKFKKCHGTSDGSSDENEDATA
ncbi:MAG: SEC-C metal-binding domain-containing protein, partial [Polyangiaceae bacterium]